MKELTDDQSYGDGVSHDDQRFTDRHADHASNDGNARVVLQYIHLQHGRI